MKPDTVIISRQLEADTRATALENGISARLSEAGCRVIQAPPLYHIREDSSLWAELAKYAAGEVIVYSWLHPRPTQWLLRRHAIGEDTILAFNISTLTTVDEAWEALRQSMEARGETLAPSPGGRVVALQDAAAARWYPVVDQLRCVNCHHCLQFCLFGVYTAEDGKLVVRNPDKCKPGCPACSRICPEGAIMFPLCKTDAAIAGAPGLLMSPDAAARRMFYMRTKKACPVCGQTQQANKPVKGRPEELCPECGGPRMQAKPAPAKIVHDDLDALVDQLDDVMRRKK